MAKSITSRCCSSAWRIPKSPRPGSMGARVTPLKFTVATRPGPSSPRPRLPGHMLSRPTVGTRGLPAGRSWHYQNAKLTEHRPSPSLFLVPSWLSLALTAQAGSTTASLATSMIAAHRMHRAFSTRCFLCDHHLASSSSSSSSSTFMDTLFVDILQINHPYTQICEA